eukprot:gene39494-48801_t
MSVSALSAGASGLNANQQALGVAAHNVANASTQGYQPRQAQFHESRPGAGLSTGSGTNLATEITNSLVYKAGFELNAKVIQAADERIGTLINIKA